MSDSNTLCEAFEENLLDYSPPAEELSISHRGGVEGYDYVGEEYRFSGSYFPVRPIIETVRSAEDRAIETVSFVDEGGKSELLVFVVNLNKPLHDRGKGLAFTERRGQR